MYHHSQTRQNCDDELDINGIKAEKKKTTVADGNKEKQCFVHKCGENQRSNEKEDDDDESLKHIYIAIEELALTLEARMIQVEKNLAKITERKIVERNQAKSGVFAYDLMDTKTTM